MLCSTCLKPEEAEAQSCLQPIVYANVHVLTLLAYCSATVSCIVLQL